MIMKANKQIGFIYKNEESIDKILKDGEVVFERGFLREKTSTTLPITFGGVGKDLKDYRVYGNTYQRTTDGKNLIPNNKISRTNQGVTFTPQEDGTYLINGQNTTNSNAVVYIHQGDFNLQAGTYYGIPTGDNNVTVTMYVRFSDDTRQYINLEKINNINKQIIYADIYIQVKRNTSTIFNDYKVYPMLSATPITVDDYEPYTGGQPSPNPDYPQEIISCGDRTKNLYYGTSNSYTFTNSDTATWYFINGVRQAYGTTIGNKTFYKAKVEENKTYTLKAKLFGATLTNQLVYENENIVASISKTELENGITFTSDRNGYVILRLRVDTDVTISISDIQLEEGSTATEYEPYGKYKIPVNVRSDNLATNFDNGWYNGPNQIFTNANNFKRCIAKIKPNTTYTISKKNASNRFVVITSEFEIAPNVQYKRLVIAEFNTNRKVLSFTTQDDENYLFFGYYNGTDETEIELAEAETMIVEGSTTPDKYIPYYNETTNIYLDEPLRKRVDYSDYIDFINGKVVRNISEIVLDGSESWVTASAGQGAVRFVCNTYQDTKIPSNLDTIGGILSNKFIPKTANQTSNKIDGIAIAGSGKFVIYYGPFKEYSATNFKTWLSSNNVTVDYVLETPTEESITLPNIPTVEGNNTLNIETEITPSQVYIKYKSNE